MDIKADYVALNILNLFAFSSGPNRGRLFALFFLNLGGPANGHASWFGHAEETPGMSPLSKCITDTVVSKDVGVIYNFFCSVLST